TVAGIRDRHVTGVLSCALPTTCARPRCRRGCWGMLRPHPPGLLRGRAEAADAERLAARTWEFSQFLVRRLGRTTFESDVEGPLAYHDSCHLLRGLHEGATPRTLLNNLSGAAVVPLPGSDECCGFGGSFSVRLPEVS